MKNLLLAAAAAAFVAGSATAGLYDFNGYGTGIYNDTVFGTNALPGNQDNGTQHEWGTVSTYEDESYAGFTYWMQAATYGQTIELAFVGADFDFDPDWYDLIWMDFMGVSGEFGDIVSVATTYGSVTTDGTSIFWETGADGTDGLNYENVFITFEVPAPGALALLGLAGLVGRRRR